MALSVDPCPSVDTSSSGPAEIRQYVSPTATLNVRRDTVSERASAQCATARGAMSYDRSDRETLGDDHLAERPVRSYLGDDETVEAAFSNARVGVTKRVDGGTERIEPGAEYGSLAVLTEGRVIFLVGQADGDDVTSVPYVEFAGVEVRTETLTRTFVVETVAGATWEFTVREANALDDAVSYLSSAVPARLLAHARERRDQAGEATDCQERLDGLEAALDAFRRATTVVDDPAVDAGSAREDAVAVIADLVAGHLERARYFRSLGNWSAGAGDPADASDRYDDARGHFDRALELATSYPPGDAVAIEAERDDLVEKRNAVELSASVASALDD